MPRFAANLNWLYTEHAFLDRFAAAAGDGFDAIELLDPYSHPIEAIAAQLRAQRLRAVLINAPAGDWAAGERGLACLPDREADFRAGVIQALQTATALGCPRVHILSGIVPAGADPAVLRSLWIERFLWAAEQAAGLNLRLCIEPINGRDMPGYFLSHQAQALSLLDAVDRPNLGLQFDVYHCQIVEGDVSTRLRAAMASGRLAHVQIAGVPDRHEPDEGELRVEYLIELLDRLGYAGHIGCEYRPRADTAAGLAWMSRWI